MSLKMIQVPVNLSSFFIFFSLVSGQVLNRVRVNNHREYMAEIIGEVVREVERREWCNLKLRDSTQEIDENVLNWHLSGNVAYRNGFVTSIQIVDILQSSLNQIWTGTEGNVTVEIRGQLRMSQLAMGFDVEANFDGSVHHYTGMMVHPLVTFDFSVFRNVHTHAMTVGVTGTQLRTTNVMSFLPSDKLTDALSVLFDPTSTSEDVSSWATEVLHPIAIDVITNKVKFPGLCYDCPVV